MAQQHQQRRAHHLLLCLALWASAAAAMYEDQAGTFDWHRTHIGEVIGAGHAAGRDRFYAATAQGFVAAISAADGAVPWRRTHAAEDPLGPTVLVSKPSCVVASSRGGRYLRAWDAADGSLRWEALVAPADTPAGATAAVAAVALKDGTGVAVAAGSKVQVHRAAKGDALWSAELGAGLAAGAAVRLVAPAGSDGVAAAAFEPG